MISNKMEKALNEQLNAELFSSYLYLSIAAHFEANNWRGFANWMKKQSEEEYEHAMKFFEFINEVGKKVTLDKIEKPKLEWNSPLEAFEEALKHEEYITKRINDLVNLAIEEKDHATNNFLQWFVKEQVEEVSTVQKIVETLKLIGDSTGNLFMLDYELGKRE
ncbi:MAG: ferritin [Melioribacter sp.]|uniref:ferritin n=1 Tax=Rosettibacter primus TaxID=3111523 RepID=UPI00247B6278|nr:ferritin [Melioribacter sp.]